MTFEELLSIAGAVLLSLGGGAAIVLGLSKYLGGIIAARILEKEKAAHTREQELLVRRRNVYAKLALTLRIFLQSAGKATPEEQAAFLAAYDEAALWASEEVISAVAVFLDLNMQHAASPGSVSQEAQTSAYVQCITAMRKDSGFPATEYLHRVVSFLAVGATPPSSGRLQAGLESAAHVERSTLLVTNEDHED